MSARRLAAGLLALLSMAAPARGGAPSYDSFCDRDGRIRTKEHGLGLFKLLSGPGQLEAIYEDAQKGNARAKRVFEALETDYFPDTGRALAEQVSRPPCLVPVLRELSGWCVPDWSFLDFLSRDTLAGTRLRVALLNGYMERARQWQLENQLIFSAMTSLLGVSVVATALREAGAAASVTAASDAPGVAASALRQSELLREAAAGSRNFGLGSATRAEADSAGRAWVGGGARVASDGSTLVSQDGLRQYRPPSLKPRLGKTQANFERRQLPNGPWQSNGHLDIVD